MNEMVEKAIYIQTPRKLKTCGKIINLNGKRIFYREVRSKEFSVKKINSYGLQPDVVSTLYDENVKWIYHYNLDEKRMYRISLDDFNDKSQKEDIGDGEEMYVRKKYFKPIEMNRVNKWTNNVEFVI